MIFFDSRQNDHYGTERCWQRSSKGLNGGRHRRCTPGTPSRCGEVPLQRSNLRPSRPAVEAHSSCRSLEMARLCLMWPRELAVVYSRKKGKPQVQLPGSTPSEENENAFTLEIASQVAGGGHGGGVTDLVLVSLLESESAIHDRTSRTAENLRACSSAIPRPMIPGRHQRKRTDSGSLGTGTALPDSISGGTCFFHPIDFVGKSPPIAD